MGPAGWVHRRGRKYAEEGYRQDFSVVFLSLRFFTRIRRRGTRNQPGRLGLFAFDCLQPFLQFGSQVVGLRQAREVADDLAVFDEDQGR